MNQLLISASLILGLGQTVFARTPYTNWLYSGSIYVLTTPAGANMAASVSETNFPLLVRLNADFFDFSRAQTNGGDIRFTTSAGANLAYEIEEWNPTAGTASIWVKIPTIQGNTNQPILMHWGQSDATSQSSGPAVFNSTNGYVCVLHLNETVQDAVGSLSPTDKGTTLARGIIGKGRHFIPGQGIDCGTGIATFPDNANPHSSELWFRADAANATLLGWGIEQAQGKVVMAVASPPSIKVDCYFSGGNVSGGSAVVLSQWYHVAHTYQNGAARLYINGVLDGSNTGGRAMAIPSPARMNVGGWYGHFNFAGAMDEVRISKVARSADWVKLEYENQNPLQTLAGNLVLPGTNFSVSPGTMVLNEGSTTNLTARAGGAIKVYWLRKQSGQCTVIGTDRLSCALVAGRVTGNQSYVVQFKAVYADGTIRTRDVPVTVRDTIPDPVFTLAPSTNLWDGRTTMTVRAHISNWSALMASGGTHVTYHWSVAGVAVARQIADGTLRLMRSQGSGPMTVSLVMNNGGAMVSNSVTVAVREPAFDAWVVRTPAADEKAANNQFYARDDTGYGTLYYNGTITGLPNSVFLRVYANGPSGEILYTNLSQTPSGGTYAFSARIAAGLVAYKVVFGSVTGMITNILDTVTNLVCGDAYIIEGQSNAVATDGLPPEVTTSPWIRTYGHSGGGWGRAVRNGTDWWIGYWGMDLATNLVANYKIPICVINGAVGGTRIDQHQANPADHYAAGSDYSIYASLLNRVAAARLTHGIRTILWHQGENNSGAASPTGDYDYKSYQQYFVDMSAAWKQDYPNVRHYNIFQVWPNPCGMGGTVASDMLREVQRTLPRLYSNLSIMSTLGLSGYLGCHYSAAGYTQIATVMAPLVEQDNYGLVPPVPVTAPNLRRARFANAKRDQISLEFDQHMTWCSAAAGNFYLDRVGGKVISGSASNNVVTLQLSGASIEQTIDYLVDQYWNGNSANLLYGANGIAALTFYAVPIDPFGTATGFTPNTTGYCLCRGANVRVGDLKIADPGARSRPSAATGLEQLRLDAR